MPDALHGRSKFANLCYDLVSNHMLKLPMSGIKAEKKNGISGILL